MEPFKNKEEKETNKDADLELERILNGIRVSPIPDETKCKAEEALRREVKANDTLSILVKDKLYAAPETNYPAHICDYVLSVIGPILQKEGVDAPHGRDTYRHIYVSIGGKNPVKYELGE